MICVGRAILTTQVAAIENWRADGRPHGSKGGTGLEQIIDAQRLQADQASKIDVGVKGSTGLLDPACGRLSAKPPIADFGPSSDQFGGQLDIGRASCTESMCQYV